MTTEKYKLISESVKKFYEQNPYPGLDDNLMMDSAKKLSIYFNKPGKILFPGCGTGHGIVALAKLRPDLKCFGLDLSQPSLNVAKELAEKHKVNIYKLTYIKMIIGQCKCALANLKYNWPDEKYQQAV